MQNGYRSLEESTTAEAIAGSYDFYQNFTKSIKGS